MPLETGARLGPHEILGLLGVGGMGEVYRARDTKLNRDVAIKVLPPQFALDVDRLARFKREAQVLASLNHPQIGAIYGFEESDSTQALVLELVEGPTLADRIARGPLPLDDALAIARQIAEALEAAHEQGIIHRDLKPANIKVRDDGTVKVLDFGLARVAEPAGAASASVTASPTITSPALMTGVGMLLGTAAYMSPEQAKGRPADKRSDIWAFGCVLYEMLTGKRAFEGADVSDTLAAVLRAEHDWSTLPPDVPLAVRTLIQRCLQRDARQRIGDVAAVLFVLRDPTIGAPSRDAKIDRKSFWRLAAAVFIAAAVAGAIGVLAGRRGASAPPPLLVSRSTFTLPEGQRFFEGGGQLIAISQDGANVVYTASGRLYLKPLSEFGSRLIAESDVSQGPGFGHVTISPDGRWLGFLSTAGLVPGSFKKISITGGTPVTIAPIGGVGRTSGGFAWTRDEILFSETRKGIMRVSENGGGPTVLVAVDDGFAAHPQILPGNEAILFTLAPGIIEPTGAPPDTWDKAQIVVQDLKTGERKRLLEGGAARYVPTGHIVYAVGGTLFAAPFDATQRTVLGPGVPVVEGVRRPLLFSSASTTVYFDVSNNGTLVYIQGPATAAYAQYDLALFDRQHGVEPLKLRPGAYQFPRISPDGKRVAVGTDDGKDANVWVHDLTADTLLRQLTLEGRNHFPVWSPDSQSIAFQSDRDGRRAVYIQRADGTTSAERLTSPDPGVNHVPESWSRDGRTLLVAELRGDTFTLLTLSVPDRKLAPFGKVQSVLDPPAATFSPDGRWVAYLANDGRSRTIFVEPFPASGIRHVIAKDGWHPVWAPDGKAIVYREFGGRADGGPLLSVAITTEPGFVVGKPVPMLTGVRTRGRVEREYDITPDGKRFIGISSSSASGAAATSIPNQINIVTNWFEELKARVPVK